MEKSDVCMIKEVGGLFPNSLVWLDIFQAKTRQDLISFTFYRFIFCHIIKYQIARGNITSGLEKITVTRLAQVEQRRI